MLTNVKLIYFFYIKNSNYLNTGVFILIQDNNKTPKTNTTHTTLSYKSPTHFPTNAFLSAYLPFRITAQTSPTTHKSYLSQHYAKFHGAARQRGFGQFKNCPFLLFQLCLFCFLPKFFKLIHTVIA